MGDGGNMKNKIEKIIELGFSQSSLAKIAGVSRRIIYAIMNDEPRSMEADEKVYTGLNKLKEEIDKILKND